MAMRQGVLVAVALLACAAAPAPGPAERALLAAEDARAAAEIGHDAAALDRALAEDMVMIHASGRKENKAQHLASVAAEKNMLAATFTDRSVRIDGNVGVTQGVATFNMAGTPRVARYLAVYRRQNGRWLLAAWATVALPNGL